MRYIKFYLLFSEGYTDCKLINNWSITYNHATNHDINDKIDKRTGILYEAQFNNLLNTIINKAINDNLLGNYTFISFKYSIKVVSFICVNNLKIITILGKN